VLLRHADGAMLAAKRAGKAQVGRLTDRTDTAPFARQDPRRRRLNATFGHGVRDDGTLTPLYQPQLDLNTRHCTAVEALLSWQDPELGAVSPAEFVPLLESTGLIHPVGRWVIDHACRQARAWLDAGTPRSIAVNISPCSSQPPPSLPSSPRP